MQENHQHHADHPASDRPNPPEKDTPPPLGPELERVRRRLMRLMLVAVLVTLLLVGAVLVAVIYKITRPVPPHAHASVNQLTDSHPLPKGKQPPALMHAPASRDIQLAPGARLISQSIAGPLLSLETLKPDGQTELVIYDYQRGQIITRLQIAADNLDDPASNRPPTK